MAAQISQRLERRKSNKAITSYPEFQLHSASRSIPFTCGPIPREIFLNILLYFNESKALCTFRRVCKSWKYEVDNYHQLWWQVALNELTAQELNLRSNLNETPKQLVKRAHQARKALRENQLRIQKQAEEGDKILRRMKTLTFASLAMDYVTLTLVTVFTILLVLKMDSHVSLTWLGVFSPLWVVLIMGLLLLVWFDVSWLQLGKEEQRDRSFYMEIFNASEYTDNHLTTVLSILCTFTSVFGRTVTWTLFSGTSLWLILLPLKLEYPDAFSWDLIFALPIVVNAISLCVSLYSFFYILCSSESSTPDISKKIICVLTFFMACLILCFFGLMWAKVEGSDRSWVMTFAPLFILESLLIVMALPSSIYGWRVKCSEKGGGTLVGWCFCWFLALPLIFTFEVLLAENLEGSDSKSFTLLFIPIFLLEGIGYLWLLCIHAGNFFWTFYIDD